MPDSFTQLAISGMAGLLLGSLFLFLSPIAILVLVCVVAVVLLAVWRPEVAILSIILMLSTVIPDTLVPGIGIGIGRLYLTDVILIALFVLMFLRRLVTKSSTRVRTPIDLPLLLFVLWSIISAVRGYLYLGLGTEFGYFVPEVRIVLYYLMFYVITFFITRQHNIDVFLQWFLLLATAVAVATVVQYVLGVTAPFLAGRVETLATGGRIYQGTTRVTDTVGQGLLTVAFILKTTMLFTSKPRLSRLVDLAQWGLLGLGFIMTFNRTHWAMAALAFLLAALLTKGRDKQRLVRWSALLVYVVPVALVTVLLVFPGSGVSNLVDPAFDRAATLVAGDTYARESTSTLAWRQFEYRYGMPAIWSQPIMGLGLGARYRPFMAGFDHAKFDGRRYTHNAHLWIVMKTGVVGYFFWAWFSLLTVWRGIKHWRRVPDSRIGSVALGFSLAYLGVVIGAVFHPIMMTLYWVPVLATIMGINEVIIRDYVRL